jgi:hypothetical protein
MPTTTLKLSWRIPVIAAVVAILVRVPFLLHGEAFFDSDEAVEGLMARHLGDVPVFFWGQGYKGVPEVYLAAAVFAIFGVGVVQLKAVSLGIWAVAVAVSTGLGQRWYGRVGGAMTGALLATGPPSLIFSSLRSSAEVAWLTLVFAVVLLAYERSVDAPDRPVSPVVFAGCGFALWVQPMAVCFIAALCLVAAFRSRWWLDRGWSGVRDVAFGRDMRRAARVAALILHGVVVMVAAAFVFTYLGGRLDAGIVTAAHPQKVFRVLTVLTGLTIAIHALAGTIVPTRRAVAGFGWFALGLLPVGIYIARGGVPGAAIPVRTIAHVPHQFGLFVEHALPLVLGVKNPSSTWILPWWLAAVFVALLFAHGVTTSRAWFSGFSRGACRPREVFAAYAAASVFVMLVPGGMFGDILSYRYLMPFFGFAALSAASGLGTIAAWSRLGAGVLAAACLFVFLVADVRWYNSLGSDDSDRQVIRCLAGRGIGVATADYWIAYRMTFLADERVIVAPDQPPHYPPYRDLAGAAAMPVLIRARGAAAADARTGQVICTSVNLDAVVVSR